MGGKYGEDMKKYEETRKNKDFSGSKKVDIPLGALRAPDFLASLGSLLPKKFSAPEEGKTKKGGEGDEEEEREE